MTETVDYIQTMGKYSHSCGQHCFGVVTRSSYRRHLNVRALRART